MTTEQTPFQPTGSGISDIQTEEPAIETPVQPELTSTEPTPNTGSTQQPTTDGAVSETGNQTDQRTYTEDEWRKFQSSTDKRIADLETQNKNLQEQSTKMRDEYSTASLDTEVQQLTQNLTQQYIQQQGMDEQLAVQMAHRDANNLKQQYLQQRENSNLQDTISKQQEQLGTRVKMARAYELSVEHKVPIDNLMAFDKPEQMAAHAKTLSEMNRLKGQLQGNTPAQNYTSSTPQPDVAPTDAEAILDRYNQGNQGVTTEMAREAASKLGFEL